MEELLEILEGIAPGEDFENCTTLIDDHILDSFAILSLVSEIEDTFDVEVSPAELIPANFNSAKSLWEMICRLKTSVGKDESYGLPSAYIQFNIFASRDRIVPVMPGTVPVCGTACSRLYIFLYDKR